MAYSFSENTSYGRARRYTAQVIGGLKARKELAGQVDAWTTFKARIIHERQLRELADDAVLEASTLGRVEDAQFDVDLGSVSSHAFLAAGKDAKATPYDELFGKDDAKRVKAFGIVRAAEAGRRIVKDGRRLEVPNLVPQLDQLDATTARLQAAATGVEAAKDALFGPRRVKKVLIADLNHLIATTEAAILTAFPGRDDLVSAITRPWFERKGKKTPGTDADAPTPDPLDPGLEDDGEDDAPT